MFLTAPILNYAVITDPFPLLASAETGNLNKARFTALATNGTGTPSRVGKVPFIPAVRVNNAREGFLEYADHATLLDCLPASLMALFVVGFHSGCRLGELIAMRWQDVDWTNRVVRLPDSKNGRKRNLPFWGGIEDHLKRQKAYRDEHHPECEYLFFWMAEDVGSFAWWAEDRARCADSGLPCILDECGQSGAREEQERPVGPAIP